MIAFLRRLFGLGDQAPTSPWRSYPVTPESLVTEPVGVDRQIGGVGEIGMGGPNFWTLLLADGAMLHGVCGPVHDIPASGAGGPLRVVPTQAREGEHLQVYDVDAQVIYTLKPGLKALDDAAVRKACRHAAETVPLAPVCGLRLPREIAQAPAPLLTRDLPSGRQLEARCLIPDDLRGTAEVNGLLRNPPYALWLDGAPTGLHVGDLDEVFEAPDGLLVLPGHRLDAGGRTTDGLWLAWRGGQWSMLAGQAYEPLTGGGIRTPYFLSAPELAADGQVSFALRTFGWGPDGELPSQPAPTQVELGVSWRPSPMILATKANRIALVIPD